MHPPPLVYHQFGFTYAGAGVPALEDVNLSLEPGEWLLVCGASGSGKSTLARAAIGLVPHFYAGETRGHVLTGGMDTRGRPVHELFRQAALVFQNPEAQLFTASVENELAFGLESAGLSRAEMHERIAWAAGETGITHLLARTPHDLSGGEQQRIAIAAALALRPPLLMLDEPFAHLDGEGAALLRRTLKEVQSGGTAVLVIEHRLHGLVAEAGRIAVIHGGTVALCGAPRAVLAQDIERWSVGLPYPARLARQYGWDRVPLTAREAAEQSAGRETEQVRCMGTAAVRPVRSNGAPLLAVESLACALDGQAVLRDVTFQVGRGESVALLGRNGAGKTTLLRTLMGLRQPQGGRVLVGGRFSAAGRPASARARQVGMVFQNANDQLFLPSVREEMELGARRLGVFDPAWFAEVVETLGLAALLERSPFRLSEGEKKRVAIASVLAMRPDLIMLDEPAVGQDYSTRRSLIGLLQALQARGHTLLMATHDLELAEALAPRWLVLAGGRIAADGPPDDVMAGGEVMRAAGLAPTERFVFERALKSMTG